MYNFYMSKKNKWLFCGIIIIASLLRLNGLAKVPVSLFGDELDVGYHAYSLLKTGRDYYGNFLPFHLHSLAEWRTPLYLYSAVPTVWLFGISPLGVRLPAAIFGILGIIALFLFVRFFYKNEKLALLASALLAFSPWHIQYSRGAFEVTELLFFFFMGLYLFFKGLKDGKWLWLSALCLGLMPWIYSSAKLYTPVIVGILVILYWRDLKKLKPKHLFGAFLAFVIVGLPTAYSVFAGGAAQRFSYIGVFSDPNTEYAVGDKRLHDVVFREKQGGEFAASYTDRLFHNKFTYWGDMIVNNYLDSFSLDFLFYEGDINPRHSIGGIGQFYVVEAVALFLGIVFYFSGGSKADVRKKWLILFWILTAPIPSAITRDGGTHATRLILMLPPLIILMAWGLFNTLTRLKRGQKVFFVSAYLGLFLLNFIFYQHNYWVHYPWNSERWWHSGFEEAVAYVKEHESEYDRVVFSVANEPPWIFFAAWYEYPPKLWQENFPLDNVVPLEGFGDASHIDKFYFASPKENVFRWAEILDNKTLYVASAKEIPMNLILEPQRTPPGLSLMHSVAYPSGEPVFYLLTGAANE